MTDPGPGELKALFQQRLHDELRALHTSSRQTAEERKPVELDQQSVGRLSRMDAMQQQAMAAARESRRHGRIHALGAAIRRMETDDFGWCDECGGFIGLRRLEHDPTFMRCIECAS